MFKKIPETDHLHRGDFITMNENFLEIERELGDLGFEYINVGERPGDMTGDLVRTAAEKINRNFARVAKYLEAFINDPN